MGKWVRKFCKNFAKISQKSAVSNGKMSGKMLRYFFSECDVKLLIAALWCTRNLFCRTGDISKMSLWSAFTKIVAAFITQFVDVPRTWQTCRSLARLCVHFHPSLKKNVCIPLRTCVRQKEVTSVCSCWIRWELDESLISLRTEWSKWRVRMHTFVPSDENVTLFFVRGDIFAHGTWNPHFWSK